MSEQNTKSQDLKQEQHMTDMQKKMTFRQYFNIAKILNNKE